MARALEGVATGEVTIASRDVVLDGVEVRKGAWLGLADGAAVASGESFDDVAGAVAEHLLDGGREILTLLTGADEPRARGARRRAQAASSRRSRSRCIPAASRTTRCSSPPNDERSGCCSSRTTRSTARRWSCCSTGRAGSRSSARSPTGARPRGRRAARPRRRADGLPAARPRRGAGDRGRACPRAARRDHLPHGGGDARGARGRPRRRRRRLVEKGRPTEELVAAIQSATRSTSERRGVGSVNLTQENTAIVLDSTSDFPDAHERFPNMRVVPLYVNFGDGELPRPRRHRLRTTSTTACAPPRSCRRRRSRRPQDFVDAYEQLARLRADLLAAALGEALRARYQSAVTAAEVIGGDRIRVVDTETASLAVGLLALAIQRRLARGTTDEEIEALIERFKEENGVVFTVAHARVPPEGRPHRAGGGARGDAAEREADPLRRRRRRAPDREGARPAEGARGVRARLHVDDGGRAGPAARDRARRGAGVDRGAHRSRREDAPAGARSSSSRTSAPSSARTPARAPSASSGSRTTDPRSAREPSRRCRRRRAASRRLRERSRRPSPWWWSARGTWSSSGRPEKTARGLSFPTGRAHPVSAGAA